MRAAVPLSHPLCLLAFALTVARASAARSRTASPGNATAATAAAAACGPSAYEEFARSQAGAGARVPETAADGHHRRALFERQCKAVAAQNARAGARWQATVNHFADRTDAELRSHLGYRRSGFGGRRALGPLASSALAAAMLFKDAVAEAVDWRSGLQSSSFVRDQGHCGSCWAQAAAGAVEMHAELGSRSAARVSADHLLQCVPNPQHCGGSGGCEGATSELAFGYIKQHGVLLEQQGPGNSLAASSCAPSGGRRATISGFVQLPSNREEPLLGSLAAVGPVVVSVDATSWFIYRSGIFDSCPRDAVVNHAVLAVGYERDAYVIRNSWGRRWGEDGHIRLLRTEGHCGTDHNPQEGNGCQGGPREVPVCGMCGVLSDSAYPVGVGYVDAAPPSSAE